MCGIVGAYNTDGSPVDPQVMHKMMNIQRHRGPDDQGMRLFSLQNHRSLPWDLGRTDSQLEKFEGVVGCNRLSILDLSENGHQPMCNESQSVFIVLNGEIYNAFQYKTELEASHFRFRSNTDTEIALCLYQRYGFTGMLERLNGMFAICIVDLNRQEMYLARDRLGIKPLYWYEHKGTILFSSEVKSFLLHPSFKTELDEARLDEYLMFRYCTGSGFLMKGVRQLEPGHWIRIRPNGWTQHRYWVIPDGNSDTHLSFNSAVEALKQQLARSVQMRLLSDVKVGCQLSGGVDSSLINILATTHGDADMDSFSIIFDDPELTEEKWIDEAASVAKIRSWKYTLDSDYFFDNLETATWHLDQPLNHPNSIGILGIAEKARPLVTVLLSGEGADELLGGYNRFLYATIGLKFQSCSSILRSLPYLGSMWRKKFSELEHTDYVGWFIAQSAFQQPNRLLGIRPEVQIGDVLSARRAIFEQAGGDYISNCLKYELRTYLVDLLVRQDKMTMAHSIENRVPYLDHELVTFVRSLPPQYLVDSGIAFRNIRMRNTKILLKKLALRYFTPEFVYRRKYGFALPLTSYFTHPRFKPLMEDVLLPGMRNRGLFDTDTVERWWRNIGSEDPDVSESIWICVAFEIWAQQYLDGKLSFASK